MIRGLYRFARGVLTVRVSGRNITRFLNLCIRQDISFWALEYLDATTLRMCMYAKDVFRMKPFLRKTRVKIHIEDKRGLGFVFARYRARTVYVFALAWMIILVALLSARIWRIEIAGNSSIGEDTLLEYLKTQNVSYGIRRDGIDNNALELALRQDFDAIIWASVYEKGTKLVVNVQEKIATSQGTAEESVCTDLVAKRDATVVSIVTRGGIPCVTAGDEVQKGELLVCGRQEILDDNGEIKEYYYQSADADVMGAVEYDYEEWLDSTVNVKRYTGKEKSRYYVSFGAWRLILPSLYADYDECETLEEVSQLVIMDSFYLPVYFGHILEREQCTGEKSLSREEVRELATEHFMQFLTDLEENGVCISDKNVMIEKVDDRYHVYGTVSASESIAEPAYTELLPQPKGGTGEERQE